jgi:pre-mRNA-splicing helicase BRR2
LDKSGLIRYDKRANQFSSTSLGKIASYYYVKYQSIAIYNDNIKPGMNLIDLFKVFAMSVEFKLLPVRE